jgi:predicted transcriptional regulator of viral defense system
MDRKTPNLQQEGYISTKLMEGRTAYYKVLRAAQNGELTRIKRGVYVTDDQLASQMLDVEKVVPGGVLCLYSAWAYYHLTTQVPQEYCLAIRRGRKITLPDYPPIALYHWSEAAYRLGITQVEIEQFKVSVYDVEKCVCDAVKYRNKIGIDVCTEIIKEYLKRPDRNIDTLMQYAAQLRVAKTLGTYLQMEL